MRFAVACLLIALGADAAEAKVHRKSGTGAKPTAATTQAADQKPDDKRKHPKGWPLPAMGPTASGDPELIFTFDDGPNPKTTPAVLDTLAKHHIHAVFFMVGEMAGNPRAAELVDRIVREGHVIGNHTMTHQDLCRLKDEARAEHEIDDARQTIEKVSGLVMAWFRTPYGVRCERIENMLDARHLGHFHWDLDPQEWKHGNAQKAIDYVEKQVGKMNGRNVLLMHDIKKATVDALPVILDWIDEENARRKAEHKRRIRIIQSYELATERLPPGLVDFLADAVDPKRWTTAVASVLP
jgi:peptidoglycan/xylan/chitin deacetylase (PgdA/CDA1 family)